MRGILTKLIINALALYFTAKLLSMYNLTKKMVTLESIEAAFLAAFIFGLVNTFLGKILKLFALPINLLTLGAFSFVINALMLLLVSYLFKELGLKGFEINGFIAALVTAFVLSIISSILNFIIR